jgi:hypothetical protein
MQHFVTEFTEILQPFNQMSTFLRERLPTIDSDAMLDLLVDHVDHGIPESWHDYARELLYSGHLVESPLLAEHTPDLIPHQLDARLQWENIPVLCNDSELLIDAIAQVGIGLEAHLKHFGLYRNGMLNYAYQGCVRYDLYEFVRKPNA